MAKNNESVSTVRRAKHGGLLTFFFAIVSIIWIAPLFLVLMTSFSGILFPSAQTHCLTAGILM